MATHPSPSSCIVIIATQVILFLLLTFLERCSILCSTNSWAENRMVNVGHHLRFYCVQGKFSARPLLLVCVHCLACVVPLIQPGKPSQPTVHCQG
jgi:hypothetical protein